MTTGIIVPSFPLVLALKALQNSIILTPLAVIEFVDRDVEAKRVDKKKKVQKKETKQEEPKLASA